MNTSDFEKLQTTLKSLKKLPAAKAIDQVRKSASGILNQLKEQKDAILKHFDNWMVPIAQEVLDSFLKDAQSLKENLDEKLIQTDLSLPNEWERWAQLKAKWEDRKCLENKILQVVAERTELLINKDLQVIEDYQSQSLAHLPEDSETLKDLQGRLKQAIEEPLKQLMALRQCPQKHTSLQQASEWVAQLQEKRETYFDQLLMKIDHVIKDVVHLNEKSDLTPYLEIEGEIKFMEKEMSQIDHDLSHATESDQEFILARLEGLLDHLEELNVTSIPNSLQKRIESLKIKILHAISHYTS